MFPMEIPALQAIRERVDHAARAAGTSVRLLAVSKRQPDAAVLALAALGQRAFGENYVQALAARRERIDSPGVEWHLIGALQSNKARDAARNAHCVQSVDRDALARLLAAHRPPALPPLEVLVQVNIDGEAGKAGCPAAATMDLCSLVAAEPRLALRGLMAIPRPLPQVEERRRGFAAMRALYERIRPQFPSFDTLSMGMSDDFELAIAEGATMVRVGTALFGERAAP